MLTFRHTLPIDTPYPLEKIATLTDLLFFDIETTGFQADVSSLYLIGCAYFDGSSLQIVQWFADSYHSEEDILHAFFALLKEHQTLIHFNGNGFDIPYLTKKCNQLHLPYTFDDITSIDLYKMLKPYKKLFALPNYKQKTIEQFLRITRNDQYSGGELIQVYGDYIKAKVSHQDTASYLDALLLHNYEDVKGMLALTDILHYIDALEQPLPLQWWNKTDHSLEAIFILPSDLPTPLSLKTETYQLSLKENRALLSIECYNGELKYFYHNYKDYYYLPKEDMAVHKSVASFVDKEYREKATKTTCYVRKSSCFLPICGVIEGVTTFKKEYHDKQLYIELGDELISNSEYLEDLLHKVMIAFTHNQ